MAWLPDPPYSQHPVVTPAGMATMPWHAWFRDLSDTAEARLIDLGFNVKAYGAKGDGVTDDTAAITAAMTAASAVHGVVFFAPGTYLVSSPLDKPTSVSLAGSGRAATTIKMQDGADAAAVIRTSGFASLTGTDSTGGEFNTEIRDLTVDGNKAANAAGIGIQLYGKHFRLDNLAIINASTVGLYTEYAGADDFTSTAKTLEAVLSRLTVQQCDGDGIVLKGPHDLTLREVVSFSNGGWGIDILTSTHATDVNTYLNTSGGIRVRASYGAIDYVGALYGTGVVGSTATGIGMHLASGGNFLAASIASGATGLRVDANNNVFQGAICNTTTYGLSLTGTDSQIMADVCMFGNAGVIFDVTGTAGGLKSMVRAFMGDATGTLQNGTFLGSWSINGYTGFGGGAHELEGRFSPYGGRVCLPTTNYERQSTMGIFYDTSAPSSGAFVVGDRVFNSNPSVGQPQGWVCTVAGTPGTWVSMGTL